jgi:hypothetical protein
VLSLCFQIPNPVPTIDSFSIALEFAFSIALLRLSLHVEIPTIDNIKLFLRNLVNP